MSVARINMVDWRSEELFFEKTRNTDSTMRQQFPNAEIMLRIKTTPTSVVAISIYPSQEKADEARVELDKIYNGKKNTVELKRTISRLKEMGSNTYITKNLKNFVKK